MLGGFWNRLGGLLLFLVVLTVSAAAWGPNGAPERPTPPDAPQRAEAAR